MKERVCYCCGSNTTYISRDNKKHWHPNKPTDLYLCNKCYYRLILNPIRNPIYGPIYREKWNKNRMKYKGKFVFFDYNPRKGICQLCNKKIGDLYTDKNGKLKPIKFTQLHHYEEYDDNDPLKGTIEVCGSCHIKEGWQLGQFDIHKGWVRPRNELGYYIKSEPHPQ